MRDISTKKKKRERAIWMKRSGYSIEEIARVTCLSIKKTTKIVSGVQVRSLAAYA